MLGYPRFDDARPNPAHVSLVELEKLNIVQGTVTQNVDNLHELAGQKSLVKLHSSLATATCLDCGYTEDRAAIQRRLESSNAHFLSRVEVPADGGEAVYSTPIDQSFIVPACLKCGGMLKPDVVFFGDSVPNEIKRSARETVLESRGVLLMGTTCQVFSCFRLVREANDAGIPIAAINQGKTRVDDLLAVQVEDSIELVLPKVLEHVAYENVP